MTAPSADPGAARSALVSRLALYARLVRLDKPIGTLLLLWPTLWALWFAGQGRPDPWVVAIFVAGTFLMRSAGCAINDVADRDFDPHVARTRNRPLAARAISTREAVVVAVVLALTAFVLILPLNALTIGLSFAGAFLAGSYPFTKRFFVMPQAYLGVAFGFGIPMAFAALTNALPALAWWMLAANILWTIAYDTEYAMVDREDDRKIGIRTSALLFGRFDLLAIAVCHAGFLLLMAACGAMAGSGLPYYVGLAAAGVLIVRQVGSIASREPAPCFQAFLDNNRVGGAVFAGILLDSVL